MHKIYNTDGTYKEYSDGQVTVITGDSIIKFENYNNGVNLHLKDGSVQFLDNAKAGKDGLSIKFD